MQIARKRSFFTRAKGVQPVNYVHLIGTSSHGNVTLSKSNNSLENFALACWLKFPDEAEFKYRGFSFNESSGWGSAYLAYGSNYGYDIIECRIGIGTQYGVSRFDNSSKEIDKTKWHHYAVVKRQTVHSLYVDGVLKESHDAGTRYTSGIGNCLQMTGNYDNTKPGELWLCGLLVARQNLSDEDIQLLARSPYVPEKFVVQENTVYDFSEGTGTIVNSATGDPQLTISNFEWENGIVI